MILTIDYLILNFKGYLTENKRGLYKEDVPNPFSTVLHQYGNKTFKDVYDLFFYDERIGLINSNPRSNIIDERLLQIQFENHLFYTYDLRELGELVFAITDYFDLTFDAINRLDIAHDKNDYNDNYVKLYLDLINGEKKIKGREKAVQAFMLTKNGSTEFNGFTIGKRTSSRLLRIYNKTKALLDPKTSKSYIYEYFQKNGLTDSTTNPVWRFEYQLNAKFFTDLRERNQNITHQIFDLDFLLNLIQMAERNHFEIVYNTGKTETNKEQPYILNDWQQLAIKLKTVSRYVIEKIKKVFEPSITVQKRLIKSLFRQYYIEQNLAFLFPMTKIINEYNLKDWFYEKYQFYMMEFINREKIKNWFNEPYFLERYYSLTC